MALDFGTNAAALPAAPPAPDKTPASPPVIASTPATAWLVLALALGYLVMG